MKNRFSAAAACLLLLLAACKKQPFSETAAIPPGPALLFKEFLIPKGQHYAMDNTPKSIETAELKFTVRFDSSAIYQTSNPENQYDINKLYGFSDNGEHHQQFSARFGWRWSNGALRLFAYTYNNGVRSEKELGTVSIGKEASCAIKAAGEVYIFTLNNKVETVPRQSASQKAKGYRLYPYFGGDETAPHDVHIWIKEE